MREHTGPRRTQFSSCDACRNSRLACDAARVGYDPNLTEWAGSCSRCTRRKRPCTFEWMKEVKRPVKQPRRTKSVATPPAASSSSPESIRAENDPANTGQSTSQPAAGWTPRSSDSVLAISHISPMPSMQGPIESVSPAVKSWLERIYESSFEQIFGFWLGRDCCPFVWDANVQVVLPPSRLFAELDTYIDQDWEARSLHDAETPVSQRQDRDGLMEQSVKRAIHSFASQWLHIIPKHERIGIVHEDLVRDLWRAARRDMLKVINRVSYRSVLALFIFGLTPIPVGISTEEEMDGLTGHVCVQAALQQVQRLRERQRNCQFSGSKVSPGIDPVIGRQPTTDLSQAFLTSESRAYWAALMVDTSASFTLNFRSSLSSGLHGVGSESSWRVLRMGANSFHTRTEEWRTSTFEVSDETTSQIVAAAAACSVYVWKMIAVLKEALREGDEEEKVIQAWKSFLESVDIFQVTFRPLLTACLRRLHFLSQVERLNWYEITLHYHLGILILVDAVEAAERVDLLSQLTEKRLDAEGEAVNAVKFGLENTLTISSKNGLAADSHEQSITVSFVQIDPYPHHMVAGVQLMNKAITRQYRQGKIKIEAYKHLQLTLLRALEQLPQTSKSVQEARQNLHASLAEFEPLSERRVSSSAVQWPRHST
ncbi:hypothetical protein EDD37DRAFT_173848 [Exophiala viscosa]|uniref:uncharacterized protein n=1 Tax=Exophiala viscosa TaxID=2486360 RepID=UPI002192A72C|nr:hypothetical protein EDD37DRAFT_173848 [Exophiala viscosa]